MQQFISENPIFHQRAGFPLSYIVVQHPEWILPRLGKIIAIASKPGIHNAVRRNTTKMLENIIVPKKYKGIVMDLCFRWIEDPKEKAAIKAFSLTILEHMMDDYPEIGHKLKVTIEDQWHSQTPAFKFRAKKVLNKLKSSNR